MVAVDDQGKPSEVPGVAVEGPDEERRQREAEVRRSNRLAERDQLLAGRND
jgi:acyl-CoA hydrolase